jgi:hypothetical protein
MAAKLTSQNSDTTAPGGRELYHLQFLLQATIPETFGYTLVRIFELIIHRISVHLIYYNTNESLLVVNDICCKSNLP